MTHSLSATFSRSQTIVYSSTSLAAASALKTSLAQKVPSCGKIVGRKSG
jgi:hypothetical protein